MILIGNRGGWGITLDWEIDKKNLNLYDELTKTAHPFAAAHLAITSQHPHDKGTE